MKKRGGRVSFSDKDYRAAGRINNALLQARTRQDLQECIVGDLLKLFKAEAGGYGWTGLDFNTDRFEPVRLMEAAGCPGPGAEGGEFPLEAMALSVPYMTSLAGKFAQSARAVIAHGIDIPQKALLPEFNAFFTDHPEYDRSLPAFNPHLSMLMTYDPDFSILAGMWRYSRKPWTLRDVRVLELIRPALLLAIKNVTLNEQLAVYKNVVDALSMAAAPMALVDQKLQVLFTNDAFAALLPWQAGREIPGEAAKLAACEIACQRAGTSPASSVIEVTGDRRYGKSPLHLALNRIDSKSGDGKCCFLVRLQSAGDGRSRMSLYLQQAGLTGRETEIACLTRDGFTNHEIAERLFISLHTVKNHLKKVHKKLGVDNRVKLMALLNKIFAGGASG